MRTYKTVRGVLNASLRYLKAHGAGLRTGAYPGWIRGADAINGVGLAVDPTDRTAKCFCARGLVYRFAGGRRGPAEATEAVLAAAIPVAFRRTQTQRAGRDFLALPPETQIVRYNDARWRTVEDVQRWFERALAKA